MSRNAEELNIAPIKTIDGLFMLDVIRRTPDLAENFPGPAKGYSTVVSAFKRAYRNSKATRLSLNNNGQNKGSVEVYIPRVNETIVGMGALSDLGTTAVIGYEESFDSPESVNGHNVSDWIAGDSRGNGYGTGLVDFLVDRAAIIDGAAGKTTWTIVKPGEYDEELALSKGAKLAGIPADYSNIDGVAGDRQILYIPR